jgi:acyl-CoA dehydrogenase
MQRTIFEAEHDMFREGARRFVRERIGPHAERWREQGYVDRDAFRLAGEQGYLLMWADEKYGGAGITDFRYEQILDEENHYFGETGFFLVLHSRLVAPYIGKLGNDEQKAEHLPGGAARVLAIADRARA